MRETDRFSAVTGFAEIIEQMQLLAAFKQALLFVLAMNLH